MKVNDQHGKFTGPAEVRLVRTLPGPIERIWEYLTDPEKRSRWFAGGPMDLHKGGKVFLHFRHKDISPDEAPPKQFKKHHETGHTMEGVITQCEPPRLLAYTFGSDGESEVIFELTAQGKDVVLVVTHRATGGDVPYMAQFASGWHTHFAVLIALLEGTPVPRFWALHAVLKEDYEKLQTAAQAS